MVARGPTREAIEAARRLIAGQVLRTPTLPAPALSALFGADVFVKYETMQATGAFKERGAIVKLASLSEAERGRGVIAMSAGNHAQAVALHAARAGVPATIVMPQTTPFVKVAATRAHGARVVLDGETLAESRQRAAAIQERERLVWVHPYDDPAIMAGTATIACEMLEDAPDLDVLVVPIGGGGLVGGIATAARQTKPGIGIVGVEAALYPSMWNTVHGGDRPCGGPTLAEGIAVKQVGETTAPIVKALVDHIALVSESELERAVYLCLTSLRTIAEGAGAAGIAALLAEPERFRGKRVGIVLCGGNIDPRILSSIVVRELEREGRIVSIRVDIPDRPGLLARIASVMGAAGANILEVSHRRLFLDTPAKGTKVDVTVEARDEAHVAEIMAALAAEGFAPKRVSIGGAGLG